MIKITLNIFSIIIICSLFFSSCKKEDKTDEYVSAARDYARAEMFVQEIFKIIDEAAKNEPEVFKLASLDCATITLHADTPGVFPKTLHINYGLVNCIGSDGRRRRGEIIATFNAAYSDPGAVVNISFNNFFINDYKAINNFTITNTSNLIQTQHQFTISNVRFLSPNGRSITINGNRNFLLAAGSDTQSADDDLFHVSGTFNGTDLTGASMSATTTQAMNANYECRSYFSGLVNVNIAGTDGVFDYGDGTCDDKASVTLDGRAYFLDLE